MSQWPVVELHKVAKISSGDGAPQELSAFGETGTPFIRAGSLTPLLSGIAEMKLELILESESKQRRMRKFPASTIVFAKSGMSCTKGLVYELQREAHVVNHLAAIECCNQLSSRFLLRWFQLNPPTRLIANPSYPSIRISDIRSEQIPLPPLKEQKRIAAILDAADAMRAKRREAIALLDNLLQSTFLEMFGDPITNPMGWEVKKLKEISTHILSGTTPKGGKQVYSEEGIVFIRSQNVWRNTLVLDDVVYIDGKTHQKMKKSSLKNKDILMTKTGRINTENSSLGRAAIFLGGDDSANINGHVYLIRLQNSSFHRFILYILTTNEYKEYIRRVCVGAIDKRQINKEHLEEFPIIFPPPNLQCHFATIVESVEEQKHKMREHLAELETLFASLQKRAFNGEL